MHEIKTLDSVAQEPPYLPHRIVQKTMRDIY